MNPALSQPDIAGMGGVGTGEPLKLPTLPEQAPQELDKACLQRLEQEMAVWRRELAVDMNADDAFRYEMFSRRLMAAAQGSPSAVEWAWNWYRDLFAADYAKAIKHKAIVDANHALRLRSRAEIARGHCGNRNFQAFLDTLENPEEELYGPDGRFNGWKYLVWIGPLIGAFERRRDLPDSEEERRDLFRSELIAFAAQHAAPRLRKATSDLCLSFKKDLK